MPYPVARASRLAPRLTPRAARLTTTSVSSPSRGRARVGAGVHSLPASASRPTLPRYNPRFFKGPDMASAERGLRASELECVRGLRRLFQGLSFSVGPGDMLWVLGANGSGKTSLLRLLCGLARPES